MASTESLDCQETTADPQVNYDSNNTSCFETGLSMPLHDNLTESIPIEIVFVILSLLGPKELLKVSLLNSFYLRLSKDDSLWKPFCSPWGINQDLGVNWKDLFKRGLQDQRNLLQEAEKRRITSARGGWTVAKGDIVILEGRPCKVVDKLFAKPGRRGICKMCLKGIDLVTGKKHSEVYNNSSLMSPVKEPIQSIVTEYLLSDLKKAEEADVDILELLHPKTGETRSITLNNKEVEGNNNKGDSVRSAWENASNTPNSVTVRVLDITWGGKDGEESSEGSIMDSHLWEN